MKKTIFALIIIAMVVIGGYSLFNNKSEQSKPADNNSTIVVEETGAVYNITYTDTGYSPSPLEINIGDTVVFKNNSSQTMWPASSMHPSHKDYPTTGGCLGSTFDACKGVQPGDNWSFQFDIVGDWKYHDHISSKKFGAIIVR